MATFKVTEYQDEREIAVNVYDTDWEIYDEMTSLVDSTQHDWPVGYKAVIERIS